MYAKHFGLKESAFSLTPDPRYLFLSDAHQEALASMIYGVRERRGFILILGEVGTGKTTLVRHILGQFGAEIRAVYLFQPRLGFDDLLTALLRELDIPRRDGGRQAMVEALNEYLIAELAAGRYVVLIIDEAQHLSAEVLEELRLLSNLETASSKLLQIILVGQPELGIKLGRPQLRQLRQRIGLVAQLEPLSFTDTKRYIQHRLRVAGREDGSPFTARAVRIIHKRSGGIPRLINVLCDKSLVLAYGADTRRVGGALIKQVLKDWEVFTRPTKGNVGGRSVSAPKRSYRGALVAAAALISIAAMSVPLMANRGAVPRVLDRPWRQTAVPASPGPEADATIPVAPSAPAVQADTVAAALPPAPVAPAPSERVVTPERPSPPREVVAQTPDRPLPPREVVARAGDTLAAMTAGVYGRADYTLLDFVRRANPSVVDVDVIEVGRRLRFPQFEPESLVVPQPDGTFAVHVLTVPSNSARAVDDVRAKITAAHHVARTVPVQLSRDAPAIRILAGDFKNREDAVAFSTAFQAHVSPRSNTMRSTQ